MRTKAKDDAKSILDMAEQGQIDGNILEIRKAGGQYAKQFILNVLFGGQKNPVKKLSKMLKDTTANDHWPASLKARAVSGREAFASAEAALASAGEDAAEWTVHDVKEKIDALHLACMAVKRAYDEIGQCLKEVDSARSELRKKKALDTRTARQDMKRQLHCFEEHKLPQQFRLYLKELCLVIDPKQIDYTAEDLPDFRDFDDYKPSQDSEGGEFNTESWALPKWWGSDQTTGALAASPAL